MSRTRTTSTALRGAGRDLLALVLPAVLTVGLSGAAGAMASTETIGFDEVAAPGAFHQVPPGFGNGPHLEYAGVTLDGGVILSDVLFGNGATTAPNIYATCDTCGLGDGPPATMLPGVITAQFDEAVHAVELDVYNGFGGSSGVFTLTARDAEQNVVATDQVVCGPSGTAAWLQHLSVAAAGIRSVEVTTDLATGHTFAIDTLVFEVTNTGTAFCPGDASSCPCGNAGIEGRGCDNSFGTGGARLESSGTASVSDDTLHLRASGLPPTAPALFFQGTEVVAGGSGSAFGDGLRCVGGTVVRLGATSADDGLAQFPFSGPGAHPTGQAGQIPATGGVRYYQVWYRNTQTFCSPEGFNLSNGLEITWVP